VSGGVDLKAECHDSCDGGMGTTRAGRGRGSKKPSEVLKLASRHCIRAVERGGVLFDELLLWTVFSHVSLPRASE